MIHSHKEISISVVSSVLAAQFHERIKCIMNTSGIYKCTVRGCSCGEVCRHKTSLNDMYSVYSTEYNIFMHSIKCVCALKKYIYINIKIFESDNICILQRGFFLQAFFFWPSRQRRSWVTSIMCHSAKVHAAGRSFGSVQVWCRESWFFRFGIRRVNFPGSLSYPFWRHETI